MLWDVGYRERGGMGWERRQWVTRPSIHSVKKRVLAGMVVRGSCSKHMDEQLRKFLSLPMQQVWKFIRCPTWRSRL